MCTAQAQWYGAAKSTNNEAELEALSAGLKWVGENLQRVVTSGQLLVVGDSDLVIGFLTRRFKPSRKFFVQV